MTTNERPTPNGTAQRRTPTAEGTTAGSQSQTRTQKRPRLGEKAMRGVKSPPAAGPLDTAQYTTQTQ